MQLNEGSILFFIHSPHLILFRYFRLFISFIFYEEVTLVAMTDLEMREVLKWMEYGTQGIASETLRRVGEEDSG